MVSIPLGVLFRRRSGSMDRGVRASGSIFVAARRLQPTALRADRYLAAAKSRACTFIRWATLFPAAQRNSPPRRTRPPPTMWDPGDDDGPYTPRLFGQTVTVLGERSLRQTAGAAIALACYLRARAGAAARAHRRAGRARRRRRDGAAPRSAEHVAERRRRRARAGGHAAWATWCACARAARRRAPRERRRTGARRRTAAARQPCSPVGGDAAALESNSVAGRLKVGVPRRPGRLRHMEDMSVVHQSGSAEAPGVHAFCCVYDGHGGERRALRCEQLHFNVMASAHFRRNEMHETLREGIRKTEADLIDEQRQRGLGGGGGGGSGGGGGGGGDGHDDGGGAVCGSTVLVSLLCADSLHIAWLGDCRAVLSRSGTAVQLTAGPLAARALRCARASSARAASSSTTASAASSRWRARSATTTRRRAEAGGAELRAGDYERAARRARRVPRDGIRRAVGGDDAAGGRRPRCARSCSRTPTRRWRARSSSRRRSSATPTTT